MIQCRVCNSTKKKEDFYFRKDSKKPRNECKDCLKIKLKEPNKKYKTSEKYKNWKKEYDKRYHKTDKYKNYQSKFAPAYREKNKEQQFENNLRKYWPEVSTKEARKKYDQLLSEQNGLCSICKNPETRKHNGKARRLSVDHCHHTRMVRGLLCSRCNITIGRFEDNINYLREAAKYLEDFNERKLK